jgi:hypothetical protein
LFNLVGEMSEFEVLSFFSKEDVINGGWTVSRRQDVAGVSVAKQVDLLLLKTTKKVGLHLEILFKSIVEGYQ